MDNDFIEFDANDGYMVKIDVADIPLVIGKAIKVALNKWPRIPYPVARISIFTEERGYERIFLHRYLLNAADDQEVDHKNGDSLDNRRSNIRFCTRSENITNQKRRHDSTSPYRGVERMNGGKFRARIRKNNKEYELGKFYDEREAARAYNEAAIRLHGEFAQLNDLDAPEVEE